MKVKELLEDIEKGVESHGKGFLEWEVYTEQCYEEDKEYKRGEQKWNILIGHDMNIESEYFETAGGCGTWLEKKAFCIHVNY